MMEGRFELLLRRWGPVAEFKVDLTALILVFSERWSLSFLDFDLIPKNDLIALFITVSGSGRIDGTESLLCCCVVVDVLLFEQARL